MDSYLRSQTKDRLDKVARGSFSEYRSALLELVAPRIHWHVCHPIGELIGPTEIDAEFWQPLKQSITSLERKDDIFIAGVFGGQEWISATGHYTGIFKRTGLEFRPRVSRFICDTAKSIVSKAAGLLRPSSCSISST